MKLDPEGSREQESRTRAERMGWDLQSPGRGERDKICIGFLTGQRPRASSGYRKQALLLLVLGRNGGAQGPGLLWVSQHCRWGLKASSGPAPSPALLHLPEPRDGTGAGSGSPIQHSRACKRNLGSTGHRVGSKAQRVQGTGGFQSLLFLEPPQLEPPSKGPKALLASVGTLVRHKGPWRAVSALTLELQPDTTTA